MENRKTILFYSGGLKKDTNVLLVFVKLTNKDTAGQDYSVEYTLNFGRNMSQLKMKN